ncbi:MAG: glycosyltransferase [Cyanobacteria bacterium P01_A01_bin.135]
MSSYCALNPTTNLSQPPVVGYLLKTFPKLSETFILNEILELERQGVALHLFSLRSPADETPHPAVAQVKSPVTYIPSLLPSPTAQATNALIETHLALLGEAASQPSPQFYSAVNLFFQRQDPKDINELLQGIYLARELQRLNVAHLHVHFANIPAATAEIAYEICRVPFSITAHAKDIYLTPSAELDRRIAKAEFVLTCTDFNRRYLNELSTSDTPIHLAYHGIDLARFTGDTATQSAPLEVLSVGRFCEKKGFTYLLQACRQLRDRGVRFHCAIVGYGPLEAQMQAQITDYDLEAVVTLVGKLTQDQVLECYRQADAFVLPCVVTEDGDRDGIPNVLLEAMAMGLPVVSTGISGIGELVRPEENGLLVPQRDADALAQAMLRLAEDDGLRSRLGQAGQRTVQQGFTLSQNVGEVKAHLFRALQPVAPKDGWVSDFSAAIAASINQQSVNQQSVQEITS